ncbi:MAG: ABC transporter substrate-binding protein [Ruminococcaceae bacterium]|nr:ABC transporter substrate-binding protein [Oscillospiraceae bacterium]
MKKTVLCIALTALILCGCGKDTDYTAESGTISAETLEPVRGGIVNLFCDTPDTLNPIVTGYKSVSQVMDLVYDGLFRTENNFSATPVLASGYVAEANNTVYVVKLNKKIKFHNGSDFDAADVVATFRHIANSDSKYKSALADVKSCYAHSDDTVVFELNIPKSNFANLLDFPILPAESSDADFTADNVNFIPDGTGKYKVHTKDAIGITLVENKDYKLSDEPYVDEIRIKFMKDASVAKYNFEAVETDFITTDLYAWGDTAMNGNFSAYEYESNRLTFIGLNCSNFVLSDKNIRKILAGAVDKDKFVSDILYSHGARVDLPVNPNAYFATGGLLADLYESGKTLNLLKGSGWLDLDGDGVLDKYFDDQQYSMSFRLIVNSGNGNAVKLAQMLKSNLAPEGINLDVVYLDYYNYVAAVQNGDYDMFIGRTDIANDCDVSFMLKTGGYQNFYRFSSPDMDDALYRVSVANGENNIKNAYKEFESVFKDEMPVIPLYFETDAVFSSIRIKGDPNVSRTGIFTGFENVYVEYKE